MKYPQLKTSEVFMEWGRRNRFHSSPRRSSLMKDFWIRCDYPEWGRQGFSSARQVKRLSSSSKRIVTCFFGSKFAGLATKCFVVGRGQKKVFQEPDFPENVSSYAQQKLRMFKMLLKLFWKQWVDFSTQRKPIFK